MKRFLTLLSGALTLGFFITGLRGQSTPEVLPQTPPGPIGEVAQAGGRFQAETSAGFPEWSGLMAGGSLYYLKPYFQNNTAYVTTIIPTPTLFTTSSEVNYTGFHWGYNPAAAFWLSWALPDGLGVRSRFFFFDQRSDTAGLANGPTPPPQQPTSVNPPLAAFLPGSTMGTAFGSPGTLINGGITNPDQLAFGSNLKVHALDVEATYTWQGSCWSLLGFGGGRYLTLEQDYRFSLSSNGGGLPVAEVQLLNADRKFTGGGPTLGLQTEVAIGRTGLSLFASGRGALVVGTANETVNGAHFVIDPTGLVLPVGGVLQNSPHATRTSDHVLTLAEVEFGLEYDFPVGNSRAFLRSACVSNTYFDAGNAVQSTGNLNLFGLQMSLGWNY